MEPIRIRTKVESETLRLPQLQPLIGRTVEITIEAPPAPAVAEAFYAAAGHVPETEAEWQSRREMLKAWRTDSRFEPYWPVIDHVLAADFASARRWAAAAEAVRGLSDYDFDAWREQREFDRLHAGDHLP